MSICIGEFSVPLFPQVTMEKRTRLVPGTRAEERKTLKRVLVTRNQEITNGCSNRCAGLGAYTKTSLRRAIKENDLTASGSCYTCGLRALVGEGRKRVEIVPFSVMEEVESVEIIQVPCMVEEAYYVETQSFQLATLIEKPKITVTPALLAPTTPVTKIMNVKKQQEEEVALLEPPSELNKAQQDKVKSSKPKFETSSALLNMQEHKHHNPFHLTKANSIALSSTAAVAKPSSPMAKYPTITQPRGIGKQLLEKYEDNLAKAFANIKTYDPVFPQKQKLRHTRVPREYSAPEHIITSIQQPPLEKNEHNVEKPGRVVFTRATRIAKQYKVVQANEKTLESLLGFLANVARHSTLTIELVLSKKRVNKYQKTMRRGSSEFMVTTRHHEGAFREIDVPSDYLVKRMESRLIAKSAHHKIHTDTLTYGDSGLLIAHERLLGNFTRHRSGWLIVRGRYEGKIIDSRIRQPRQRVLEIEHYARSVETRFWAGFDRTFREMRSQHRNHICESNFDVEECGSVAAILCQTIFPCGKITCRQCAEQLAGNTFHDLGATLDINVPIALTRLDTLYPQFKHVTSLLRMMQKVASAINSNHTAFTEIQRIIGDRTEAPFSHINKINEILIKGNQATSEEFSVATQLLLELARYQRNRTENIKSGSLNSFRNKISGKAHINPTLMCDNQLDANGNFVWGKRGYHAKRFFSNYFEEINPAEGYDKYVVREHPNGARKLAIANLIVSTNFENLRKQLKGEPVEPFKLTQQCISMKRGNFEYPCCCVTLDDGTPFESEIKMPTKNHLVVGNSGDSKFVDLPTDASNKMYIAKPGYCYINIFLAMLVNVNEDDAKDFTKMVRDVIVDKLGKWPSMLDVATACFLLRTFFPDTHNAELPRILVDHKTKTMHVIDSYGSLNTGYHVLKANTVSQLILFASDSLESEMKHYLVGGDISISHIETENVKLLIRSIYKPRLMKTVLIEEPYILILSILSPGVLLALFNSGSLERMIHELIRTDQNVATIATILSTLAMKVSLADTLTTQLQVITEHAGTLAEVVRGDGRALMSRNLAITTLERILARGDAERALSDSGYRISGSDIIKTLMEKSYLAELDAAWNVLSWSEKFCAIKESYKWRKHIVKSLNPQKDADLNGRYDISVTSLVERARGTVRKCIKETNAKCEKLSRRVTSYTCRSFVSIVNYLVPDIFKFINVIIVISVLLNITVSIKALAREYQSAKLCKLTQKRNEEAKRIVRVHKEFTKLRGMQPTEQEFLEYIEGSHPDLLNTTHDLLNSLESVEHQAKRASEVGLERIIAFTSLVLMIFDQDRSDCVYKILTKLKGIMGAIDADVCHQSIDEIQSTFEEKKTTIDFELDSDVRSSSLRNEPTFSDWWANQLERNNVIPHYRTEGHFMEFTRQNAAKVANDIAHGPHNDIIVRGGVGSGKSTGLPFNLSAKGKVLLLEPTRPLAENVCKQLRGDPFFTSPTLRMRGLTSFGSSPIVIMTSGFALHYYAHNPMQLEEFGFVLFDECHVNDSSAMAFRCLLHEYNYTGKIVKVSATPPGREIEYKPQCEVVVAHEVTLSFEQFVAAQNTGSNADVVSRGDNILVYVASYSEVDTLSRLLVDKGYKVTKVDGRTMKVGNVEITTHGTSKKKHFIVATNIIENGVTLDIDVVVDFGTKVSPRIDVDCRAIRCGKDGISYGERIQRLGRVGRHKEGYALKVGTTQKGLLEVPPITATEAAFLCFTYGLPVMTQNVATTFISGCTVKQARTMLQFELSVFYTVHLVRYDGTMHPAIHRLLKPYKLRDSETLLSKLAIPSGNVNNWFTAKLYANMGYPTDLEAEVRVPFYAREVPEKLHEQIWKAIKENKKDAGFGRISSASACKIAYTLKTDVFSVQRTIQVIESLIEKEMEKQAHFRAVIGDSCSNADFTLASIAAAIRARYAKDHTTENIGVLQAALAQLKEFSNLHDDASYAQLGNNALQRDIAELGAMECVLHQSEADVARALQLKGRWDKSLITRDVLILAGVTGGGVWMLYNYFKSLCAEKVYHQGYNKRQRQKLKFRNAREAKLGREVYGDDGTIEHYFGKAYTEKGKTKGRTHGMGAKNRRFVNMYGYDPADYSFVRFVDPLTGITIDESPYTSIDLIQEHFSKARMQALIDGELEKEHLTRNNRVEAYYIKNMASKALKVDLTPHNPLLMCKTNTIAGYPEREFELRQTGKPQVILPEQIPQRNEAKEEVDHEASSTFRGMRDYNPLASVICQLTNESEGHREIVYGLGFGSMIITNQHLFKRNNGSLSIRSRHGDFTINSIMQLKVAPLAGRDIVLIQLPKDFPPFPQKLKFRPPKSTERVCMVGTLFQERYLSSLVSETSATYPVPNSHFWKHWITTKVGDCGLPLVSTTDGSVLGIHSLANVTNTNNYYTTFPDNFASDFLLTPEQNKWTKHWKYNANEVCWGSLCLQNNQPDGMFKVHKLITDLVGTEVYAQSKTHWVASAAGGNLMPLAKCPNQLVTKHVVKGKCTLFETYLQVHPDAKAFFSPLLDAYNKSRLNKDAYLKDILKYATPITIGAVDCSAFEQALSGLVEYLKRMDFGTCVYVTDPNDIFDALNMKSAVGAMYTGKKREYFADYTDVDKESIIFQSCKRLFLGQRGLWNGSLKAELRPVEKVEANKTRTFTAAPIDTLLGGKVCVDDFNNRFYSLHLEAPWSVGMTKFYGGWDRLLRSLPDGWIYCDADGSQFDSSLSPYLINAVLQLRLEFMEEWDIGAQMLANLYTEIVYTPISAPDGTVLKKCKGNNSGQPSTVVDNTLMVVLAMYYSLIKAGVPVDKQAEVCKYFVNGDDLLLAVRPDYEFVLDTFKESFLTLGLKYEFNSRHTEKEKLWFMSHQGKLIDDIYIPKLEQERIVSILQWDRSTEPVHRLEAICAAMIESWGHTELTHEIRKFYQWILEQAPYNELAKEGKAPYISELALRRLYTNIAPSENEIEEYLNRFQEDVEDINEYNVVHQSREELDAGKNKASSSRDEGRPLVQRQNDQDVNVGTTGGGAVPRLKQITAKLSLPKVGGKAVMNLTHLLMYTPDQVDLSNARSSHKQFETWYNGVKHDYDTNDEGMSVILNGLMVWCIENGTSPNINGMWVMMDGSEQVEFPIKPLIDHAKPTFRQIMAHFSNVAEAYIEKRNYEKPYMPRYGLQRNLNDMSLARYAFDFYEMTSKTPARAREAHIQMKAAALRNANTRMFGLDGNITTKEEDTERHTADDVNRNMHSLNGSRSF